VFGQIELGDRTSPVTPTVRVALSRSLEVERQPASGRATFQWTEASIEGCPLRVPIADRTAFRPCAAFAGGVLEAGSSGVDTARGRTRPWFSGAVHGRLGWEPLSNLELEIDFGAVLPLHRETFFFEPGVSVYRSPIIALSGRAGVGLQFP
jgi:hypothetical protein